MRTDIFKKVLFGSVVGLSTLAGCTKDKGADDQKASGPDIWDRQWITLLASYPDENQEAGNGGTMVYALTPAEAIDANKTINIYANGSELRSQRTARAQASANGNFIYNIQYTGESGGTFNKYKVSMGPNGPVFTDTREEVDTEPILGSAPRWVKAAEGIGVGVFGSSEVLYTGEGLNAAFTSTKSMVKIATIDLDNPEITRQTEFEFPFTQQQKDQGYAVGRIDVPILNQAKTKIFIGCNVSRTNPAGKPTLNTSGDLVWPTATREIGTVTLVVDYPSLQNPKIIISTRSKANNHAYRTMSQYVAEDGDIYQAATDRGGHEILRIDKNTNDYDASFCYNLNTALGTTNARIQAWRYLGEGKGFVLYSLGSNSGGGYMAIVDLTTGAADKIANDYEATLNFSQWQGLISVGDNVYVPLTPVSGEGRLYVINWKTKLVTKGAKLAGQTGSSYIGSY